MSRTTYCNLDDQRDRSFDITMNPAFVIAQLARSILDSPLPRFPHRFLESNPNLFSTTDVNKRAWRHFSPKTLCTRGASDYLCITEFCTNEFCTNVDLCITVLSQSSHQKHVQLCVWKRYWKRTTPSTTSEFSTLGAPMAFHGSSEHHQLDCA